MPKFAKLKLYKWINRMTKGNEIESYKREYVVDVSVFVDNSLDIHHRK